MDKSIINIERIDILLSLFGFLITIASLCWGIFQNRLKKKLEDTVNNPVI